jgi:hypothetical protein
MLDPERVKLTAANIGFLTRMGQQVDMEKVKMFLQTDDSGCAKVRAEANTPVNELHVMGGQRFGMEGNMNIQDYARQTRQMNAYPLRSFSANNPAIVLPPKYGGFPRYISNEGERTDYVSRFTEPLSAPLQQNTLLLGSQGYTVTNNSASDPFTPQEFEMNLFKSKDAIDYNEYLIRQKRYLQHVETQRIANDNKNKRMRRLGLDDGVFIGANGEIMTQVASVSNDATFQDTAFSMQQQKAKGIMSLDLPADMNNPKLYTMSSLRSLEKPIDQEVLDNNANSMIRIPYPTAGNQVLLNQSQFMPNQASVLGPNNGMQPMRLGGGGGGVMMAAPPSPPPPPPGLSKNQAKKWRQQWIKQNSPPIAVAQGNPPTPQAASKIVVQQVLPTPSKMPPSGIMGSPSSSPGSPGTPLVQVRKLFQSPPPPPPPKSSGKKQHSASKTKSGKPYSKK